MQVSQSSGASAAWMLQRLLGADESSTAPPSAGAAALQELPGAGSAGCNAKGGASPQLAGGTMSAMVGLQTQPPSASDIASTLMDALDTNKDGVVTQDEIDAALKGAGVNADTTKAFAAIDTDGDGKISKDELTTAVSNKIAEHHGHGHHHHGGPSATDEADMLLSSFDTDDDKGLSLSEVAKALGKDETDSSLSSAFDSLDSNGDGSLSSDELTSAIQARMDAALKAYTTTQQASAA